VTYVTGTSTGGSYDDVITAAIRQDGELLWLQTFDGTQQWHDQGRGIALAPGGRVLVCGNTPDSNFFANVLVLEYDAATGTLLDSVVYSSGPGTSEAGFSIAADSHGDVYVGGSTVGDGGDGLMLKFDSNLDLLWAKTWDGPCLAPYSQDSIQQVKLNAAEEPIALIWGVAASLHPDYVVVKYAPNDGSVLWEADWGSNGEDWPTDMVIEPGGDVFVTGSAINFTMQYSTIRLRGSDGALLWQEYDTSTVRDIAAAIALDDYGGVYVTGRGDPDGDQSNFNDNFYTVKRDAATGAFQWSHSYGSSTKFHFDVPADVIADREGHVFVSGYTSSPPYTHDAITFMLDPSTGVELDRGVFAPANSLETATPQLLRIDPADRLIVGAATYDVNTGDNEILVYRYPSQTGMDGHFVDMGFGLRGNYAPRLDGSGSLAAGNLCRLSFTQLPPSSVGILVVGVDLLYLPYKGGSLLPTLDLLLVVPTGINGAVDLDTTMPSGIPSDLSIYAQGWFLDPGSPKRMSATNGLELITP